MHATTVNRTDCALRAATPFLWRFFTGFFRPRVRVLGNEFAGEIEAVGGEVTAHKVCEFRPVIELSRGGPAPPR
ncbi:hypothetical protein FE391_13980 [Nonomuraea sp. KC401]|uniref:alcohol dehydrogenase catalytic domain-containing protein n=1 Tax=unclassified Nonomuraea TaxID=2593643 RepID=UPI0010FD4BA2|nr:hypothetical protein [Nonomuraea sp. KC401]NBE94928.1 hypothetical protein [Nonomuraea sp. K271]TLF74676.1 hypothetical protein FE391_13980 [Nonomuraea sp. KC401]